MKTLSRPSSLVAALAVSLGAAGLIGPSTAPAQGFERVDLELVLAVDVSQSMDNDEHRLQRLGYAEAFRHEDVIDSIVYGAASGVAVTYVEWGDAYAQNTVVEWSVIRTREDALRFADELESTNVFPERRTSISGALRHAADLIDNNNYDGLRKVIDISGDGPNNAGGLVTDARDEVVGRGIVINGLPILLNDTLEWYDIPDLDLYYEDCVIGGPGSFIAPVHSIEELGATIRSKLVLEIAGLPWQMQEGRVIPAQFFMEGEEEESVNCLVGEQMLGRGNRFR
jgi:hypothetical protein